MLRCLEGNKNEIHQRSEVIKSLITESPNKTEEQSSHVYLNSRQTVLEHRSQSLSDFARSECGPVQEWGNSDPKQKWGKKTEPCSLFMYQSTGSFSQWESTGSRMRWKRPILSTTQASCWGTNRTTVFMGKLDAHRCCAGVTHSFGAVLCVCYSHTHEQQQQQHNGFVRCSNNNILC